MTGALHALGPEGLSLALLLLGHVLADFLLQGPEVVRRKGEPKVLLLHGVQVWVAAVVVYLPLLSARAAVVLTAVALVHVAIDRGKVALEARTARPLGPFLADQALHGAVLLAAWGVLARPGFLPVGPRPFAVWHVELTTAAVVAAGAIFLHKGGTALVRGLLARFPALSDDVGGEEALQMGRLIGTLERELTFVLVLLGQWGALGLVVAAKSIARFADLQKRPFAEYYLIGTLASLLVAVVVGLSVGWMV